MRVCWGGSRGRSEFLEIVGSVCGQIVDDGTLHTLAHEQHAIHVQVPTARLLNDLRGHWRGSLSFHDLVRHGRFHSEAGTLTLGERHKKTARRRGLMQVQHVDKASLPH